MSSQHKKGFTLIELLVVISIISLLTTVVLSALSNARNKAQYAKAKSELNNIAAALELMMSDTGKLPSPESSKPDYVACNYPTGNNETWLDNADAGLDSTDGYFPKWSGPYMQVPLDPWGTSYIYDEDYFCNTATPVAQGCERYSSDGTALRALVSGGPNKSGINVYDSDNVVKVLCRH